MLENFKQWFTISNKSYKFSCILTYSLNILFIINLIEFSNYYNFNTLLQQKINNYPSFFNFINKDFTLLLNLHFGIISILSLYSIFKSNKTIQIINFIFLYSLANQLIIILNGGHIVLILLNFFLILYNSNSNFIIGFITHAQLLFIYIYNFFHKDHIWKVDFTAVEQILKQNHYSNSFGDFLINFPNFLKFGTFFFVYWELVGSLILIFLSLFLHVKYKKFLIIPFIFSHIFIFLTTNLTLFPLIMISFWILLIPDNLTSIKKDNNVLLSGIIIVTILFSIQFPTNRFIKQEWKMFAPHPMSSSIQLKILKNNTEINNYKRFGFHLKNDSYIPSNIHVLILYHSIFLYNQYFNKSLIKENVCQKKNLFTFNIIDHNNKIVKSFTIDCKN